MIFISILIHVLGNLAPKWIFKEYYLSERNKFSWKYSLFQLSGLLTTFLFVFIFVSISTLTSKERFIENKNAVYGLEFSETMESIGFVDGDRIESINGNKLNRVSEILIELLLPDGEVKVRINNNGKIKELTINDSDKIAIMNSRGSKHLKAIMEPIGHNGNDFDKIEISEVSKGISQIPATFGFMWNQVIRLISPNDREVGGFKSISEVGSLIGYFTLLAFFSMFLGVLNFLPLPGFSVGNLALTIIEKNRGKHFSKMVLYILQSLSITMVILFIIISVY